MIAVLLYIAFVLWLIMNVSPLAGGFAIIAGIVLFLALGHSVEKDEWKARCNRREYWKRGGPDRRDGRGRFRA